MANIILNKINSLDILKNYITDASATITGIEITDKTDDWAASSLPEINGVIDDVFSGITLLPGGLSCVAGQSERRSGTY